MSSPTPAQKGYGAHNTDSEKENHIKLGEIAYDKEKMSNTMPAPRGLKGAQHGLGEKRKKIT